jgi:ABC-type dipeptide/oligopeptide/nickel transport system permease subunit
MVSRDPMGRFGIVTVSLLALVALLAPVIAPHDPLHQYRNQLLAGMSWEFPLGTDHLGRCILSRLIWGGRISLSVSLLVIVLGGGVGVFTGLISGYLGGWIDTVIMRIYDGIMAFPGILFGLLVVVILGPGQSTVAFAIAIHVMPRYARLMRSRVLQEREKDYVLAARSIGATGWRLMRLHILPNAVTPIVYVMVLTAGFAVLAEASLSFLGLGTQPPYPSWGVMLSDSRPYLRVAPLCSIFPGLALVLLLLGLNFLADALRTALDPYGELYSGQLRVRSEP